MKYEIRQAAANDVQPALDLAQLVFTESEALLNEPGAIESFKMRIANRENIRNYETQKFLMFIAIDNEKIIGMTCGYGNDRILVYVDGRYHRQGIATKLTERIVCGLKLRGVNRITAEVSPCGMPFFSSFGFHPDGIEQKSDGIIFTPMFYKPGEIWDVLDENGNKTGRYAERGRKMASGDYHLVVCVWKRNSRGEWLIDKRAPRGMDIDGKWETTGGCAIAGDDSLAAALRETREELGIELDPDKGTLYQHKACRADDGHTWFNDIWVFETECPLEAIRFQKEETCDARWVTADKILEMMASGEFPNEEKYYPSFSEMAEKWKV